MLEGGGPSAPLTTRSSARSISSNPNRNGLDNEGTRDITKSSRSDFEGPLRRPIFGRPTACRPVTANMGMICAGFKRGREPAETAQINRDPHEDNLPAIRFFGPLWPWPGNNLHIQVE